MTPSNFNWTDENIATLKVMWAEGKSAATIAAHLHGVSRSAVIGKAARLGLKKHVNAPNSPYRAPPPPKVKPLVGTNNRPKKKADPVKVAEVLKIENRPAPPSIPKPLSLKLFELNHDDCRWPVSGEKASTLFCGHDVQPGCSYCPGHHRLSIGAGTRSERMAIPAKMVA